MAFKISEETRNAQIDGIMSVIGAGTLEIRTGTQPANTSSVATGTLLATMTIQNPAAVAAVSGSGVLTLPVSATAVAAGTMGWGRLKRSNGTAMIDGTVTLSGGGGDIITSVISTNVDDIVQIISFQLTAPAL